VTHPDSIESDAVFASAVEGIGLRQIDATSLARESGRPIEASVAVGARWRFSVWEELLSDTYNFTRSRAFPLFVASAVRWLAGTAVWHPYAAAGQPLVTSAAGEPAHVKSAGGRVLDPVGVPFVPSRAGEWMLAGPARPVPAGPDRLMVSLLDPTVTTGVADGSLEVASSGLLPATGAVDWLTWLVLLAIALLAAEWYFVQIGRMP
jgi:hypothetical protein